MPNHFHLVVRIRKREAIEALIRNKNTTNFSKVSNLEKSINIPLNEYDKTKSINFGKVEEIKISDSDIEKFLSKQFANLFSSYTQSFNKVYRRMGSLFIKNFKREPIHDKTHFLNVIVYTHRNPVHHGFCKRFEDWDFSSYNEIVDGVCDYIAVSKLLKMIGGLETFKEIHRLALENFDNPYDLEIP
jgi:REP element-mobilizing transposase RayT